MARTAINVKQDLLEKCIQQAESEQEFKNQSQLWKKVAELYAADPEGLEISPSLVYLRVQEWNIEIKTTKGKKGKRTNSTSPNKDKSLPIFSVSKADLRKAIINNCKNCAGNVRAEIANCNVTSCALYEFRPYQEEKTEESLEEAA